MLPSVQKVGYAEAEPKTRHISDQAPGPLQVECQANAYTIRHGVRRASRRAELTLGGTYAAGRGPLEVVAREVTPEVDPKIMGLPRYF